MKIIALSEHYYPRVGGVTSYTREICNQWAEMGHELILIVPGENDKNTVKTELQTDHFSIVRIGLDQDLKGIISSDQRKRFIAEAQIYIDNVIKEVKVDLIHNLFGYYTLQYLNIKKYQDQNIPVFATIHNVPPEECGVSWPGDNLAPYLKDKIKKIGIGYINQKRLKTYEYDQYIVPSEYVKERLSPIVPPNKITVIHHGLNGKNLDKFLDVGNDKTDNRILTVAGYVPHKRQHLILEDIKRLQSKNIAFHWNLVGPIRNPRYFDFLKQKVDDLEISNYVTLHVNIPGPKLHELYINADLYVQPSSEEGFCITALEAAAYGLPVIGARTGAIPQIIAAAEGKTLPISNTTYDQEITKALKKRKRIINKITLDEFFTKFNWKESAQKSLTLFKRSSVVMFFVVFLLLACSAGKKTQSIESTQNASIDVTKFGARANDNRDDSKAFIEAIKYIKSNKQISTLTIPNGKFIMEKKIHDLNFNRSLVIEGSKETVIKVFESGFINLRPRKISVSLTQKANRKSKELFINTTRDIEPGDILSIKSNSVWETGWNYKERDAHDIEKVEKNRIYIKDPLLFNYDHKKEEVEVNIYKKHEISISNIQLEVASIKGWKIISHINLSYFNANLKNISAIDENVNFINPIRIVGSTKVMLEDLYFKSIGYGALLIGCRNIKVDKVEAHNIRHAIAPSNACENMVAKNITGYGCQGVMDAHQCFKHHV